MTSKRMTLILTILVFLPCIALAQRDPDSLPRRGYFGVGLEPGEQGVRIFSVAPDSTAAAAGILIGDAIINVDGRTTETPESVIAAIGRHRGGDFASVGVIRNGEPRTINAVLKEYPREQMTNATVYYSSVEAPAGVRLRTILSVPTSGADKSFPAVLLIQGGGCGTIDTPIGPLVAQPELMHAIGSQGFVTLRVEKSGVGDSEGPPCASIGFKEELAGYRAALQALQSHPAVDKDRIYLLGISLGGVFAPLLAAETKVAGIGVYGTLDSAPSPYAGRSDKFFEEFSGVDVPAAWSRVRTRVLVLRGEYDAITNRADHEAIARMVNASPGASAEFIELRGLDHCWTRQPSAAAGEAACGQGEPTTELADTILAFLRSQ